VDGGTYVGIAHSLERVGLVLPVITKVSKETNRLIKKLAAKFAVSFFIFRMLRLFSDPS
jgi:hypothetical protein